jgi:toxin YoeB
MGKPEPLKHGLAGYGSRRIDDEHRMVYKYQDKAIFIAQHHYHY